MKEYPITFTAAEIRAIREGRKTQFRRIINPQPAEGLAWRGVISCSTAKAHEGMHSFTDQVPCVSQSQRIRCPYGQPGDRLRVRETWKPVWEEDTGFCGIAFAAGGMPEDDRRASEYLKGSDHWLSPVTMPRWASRFWLENRSVRVERIRDITHHDALAEGCQQHPDCKHHTRGSDFQRLWESINGPGSWAANPWVWVVEFRVVEGGKND